YTIAEVLGIDAKLAALKEILEGRVTAENMDLLGDDWAIEERCIEAFAHWGLGDFADERQNGLEGSLFDQRMGTLSGGQKTKVFLAGIFIHQPSIVLMDEPSNHLDTAGRELLYDYIRSTRDTLVVVSHDRQLLNLLSVVAELSKRGVTVYGGN